jgi:hypothetical protein
MSRRQYFQFFVPRGLVCLYRTWSQVMYHAALAIGKRRLIPQWTRNGVNGDFRELHFLRQLL